MKWTLPAVEAEAEDGEVVTVVAEEDGEVAMEGEVVAVVVVVMEEAAAGVEVGEVSLFL